jgi:hypothetical protein
MPDLYKNTGYWRPKPEECSALAEHLMAELPWGHVLDPYRETLAVEARAARGDTVIVRTGDEGRPIARVRMTFRGRPEIAAFLPETEFFESDDALRKTLLSEREA